jgi:outer membrane usher protein FimD/PapC
LTGPVTKIDWINPHARFFMDVKDESGKVSNYEVELAAPAMLLRRGWTRNALKVGESVTVSGSAAKDGSNLVNATTVTLSNGNRVFAGSSGGDGPNP